MKTKTLCLMLSLLTAASVCVAAPTSVGIYGHTARQVR